MVDTSVSIDSETLSRFNEIKLHYQANVSRKATDQDGFMKYLIGLYNRQHKRKMTT